VISVPQNQQEKNDPRAVRGKIAILAPTASETILINVMPQRALRSVFRHELIGAKVVPSPHLGGTITSQYPHFPASASCKTLCDGTRSVPATLHVLNACIHLFHPAVTIMPVMPPQVI
jgi:hypothetical protein